MRNLFNFLAVLFLAIATVGCEKNEVPQEDTQTGKVITLSASINNLATKTALGLGQWDGEKIQYPLLWSQGDKIAVINNGQLFEFTANSYGSTSTTFTCTSSNAESFNENSSIQAFYPYAGVSLVTNTNNNIISHAFSYSIPSVQTYQTNSVTSGDSQVICSTFGQGSMPMIAYAENSKGTLNFQNFLGVFKLQLKGTATVKSINILSKIAPVRGDLTISKSDAYTITTDQNQNHNRVTLDCGNNGVTLSPDTTTEFLIALLSGVHSLEVTINTFADGADYSYVKSTTKTISSSNILKMATLTLIPYIENGTHHGDGIILPGPGTSNVIWAPVNCGYYGTDSYGLMYQWGRKYGQKFGSATIKESRLSQASEGSNLANKDNFYTAKIESGEWANDWLSEGNASLWWTGTSKNTAYDPCPAGWRVPTIAELSSLVPSSDGKQSSDGNQYWDDTNKGFYFYGNTTSTEGNKIFLPASGIIMHDVSGNDTSRYTERNEVGYYWSSTSAENGKSQILWFGGTEENVNSSSVLERADGISVRCVKE